MQRLIWLMALLIMDTHCNMEEKAEHLKKMLAAAVNAATDVNDLFDQMNNTKSLKNRGSDKVLQAAASMSNKMAGKLTENLEQGVNMVVSGFSLGNAMGMLLLGAKGETEKQIKHIFGVKDTTEVTESFNKLDGIFNEIKKSGQVEINNVNRIYVDKSFKLIEAYLESVKKHFSSEPKSVDFKGKTEYVRTGINSFVAEKTKDMIKELLSVGSIDEYTMVVLLNALYFKGKWDKPFKTKNTDMKGKFHVDDKKTVTTKMMHQNDVFGYAVLDKEAKVKPRLEEGKSNIGSAYGLRMPYKGEQMDMVIILPENSKDLAHFEKKIYNVDINSLFDGPPLQQTDVKIPKFKIELELDLNKPLMQMGVEDIYSSSADLTGMSEGGSLHISKVLQKCVIKVDEKGSEAAAATAVITNGRNIQSGSLDFHANKPFLYFIVERSSGMILFSGRMVDPSKAVL